MIWRLAIAGLAGLALAGCSTTASFNSDYDELQDFSNYKTFAWADESPMTTYGKTRIPPTAEPKISRQIRAELESKGYTYVADKERADFAVAFSIGTRVGQEVVQSPTYFYGNSANWRWGRGYYPSAARAYPRAAYPARVTAYPATVSTVESYTEGTLAIDIFDVERKSPVWHGAGVKTLSRSEERGQNILSDPAKIREGVASILADFPPE